jgi:hypothetical protein
MLRFTVAALLVLAPSVCFGQGGDFQQLLAGKEQPSSLALQDLTTDWRRITIARADGGMGGLGDMMSQLIQAGMMSDMGKGKGKPEDAMGAMMAMSMLGGLFGGGSSQEPVYYTRGATVAVGGEVFLIAYRYKKPEVNFMQMMMESQAAGGKEPDFTKMSEGAKLTPESRLNLTLVNVKSIGSLGDIRPFDMNQEIAESAKAGGGLMDLLATKSTATPVKPAPKAAPAKPATK